MKKIEKKLVLVSCIVVNDKKEILLLYRRDHKHYETPGGKLQLQEKLEEAAEREFQEELGKNVKIESLKLFSKVEFIIPDGRKAIAYKFITKIISGKLEIREPAIFSKFKWFPIQNLEKYPISPDLKIILPKLKESIK